ncbi:hypothetical protein C7B80_03135 [Cyanosarcina cf. burmensis CCALA 770]|nr:hypothetical protein C7B80_03135 [Cyanosarcina cf. burmensis CCALA 770]
MATKPQVDDENEFIDDELDDEDLSELLDEPDASVAIEPSTAEVPKKASVKVLPHGMTREAVDRRKKKRLLYERRRKRLDNTILALALRGKDESFKAKVYEIVIQTGLDPEDPAFLLLIATGRLELLLEESPKELEALFDQWSERIHAQLQNYREGLEHYERAAVKAQEKAIAQSVQALIQKAAIDKFLHSINAISIAAGAALILIAGGLGWALGVGWLTWQQARVEYAPGKPRQLTLEEATALKWATSSQGQFARNLMSWNQTLLARQGFSRSRLCEQDAKQLGITLELEGRKAKSGFCTLWIVPPNQREF